MQKRMLEKIFCPSLFEINKKDTLKWSMMAASNVLAENRQAWGSALLKPGQSPRRHKVFSALLPVAPVAQGTQAPLPLGPACSKSMPGKMVACALDTKGCSFLWLLHSNTLEVPLRITLAARLTLEPQRNLCEVWPLPPESHCLLSRRDLE